MEPFHGTTILSVRRDGVVVRGVRITDVNKGMDGRSGQTRGLYLCDNVLEGRRLWPDFAAEALERAVREFHARERRFGALPRADRAEPARA